MLTTEQEQTDQGRIVTFYSFKGGVGRTMALANVAFIAATNRKRVLVMDWDLEAPGLHYYFRGMQDTTTARALRNAPGLLDLVWSWRTALHGADSVDEVKNLHEYYRSGLPFSQMTCSLIPEFDDEDIGTIHHIGAGGATILTPEPLAYEEALARFNWATFFAEEAGGTLLSALRNWAKEHYDYVFLDSRTGFADVAGICTMQMPDQVALCYIYNRQNIDGISQVAGAIRTRRGESVNLRGVPMRVARENTSEEADARARARKELIRRGGFLSDSVEYDQKVLAVRQAPNVPFYESIALITSERPRSDPLTLDYLNLASQILGENFEMPQLYEGWVERVRRRLQPREVAPDYLLDLRTKDLERATEEITQLLEKALEDQMDGDEDDEYFQALIATVVHLCRSSTSDGDVEQMMDLTLELMRALAGGNPGRWKMPLGDFIKFYLEHMSYMFGDDEELLLLDELDAILGQLEGEAAKMQRLENRRRAARLHLGQNHIESASQIVAELRDMVIGLNGQVTAEARLDLLATDIDLILLNGDIKMRTEEFESARHFYESGLKIGTQAEIRSRTDLTRMRFDLHSRLARLSPPTMTDDAAANHALEALEWGGTTNAIVISAIGLGEAVIRANDPDRLNQFIAKAFLQEDRRRSQFIISYARSARSAHQLVQFVRHALEIFINNNALNEKRIFVLFETMLPMLDIFVDRHHRRAANSVILVRDELQKLNELMEAHPVHFDRYARHLGDIMKGLDSFRSRRSE